MQNSAWESRVSVTESFQGKGSGRVNRKSAERKPGNRPGNVHAVGELRSGACPEPAAPEVWLFARIVCDLPWRSFQDAAP